MAKHVSWAACWASFLQCTVVRWCRPYMWYLVSKIIVIISNEKSKRKKNLHTHHDGPRDVGDGPPFSCRMVAVPSYDGAIHRCGGWYLNNSNS